MNSQLRDFVLKQSAVNDVIITAETNIQDDLGVSGDDAVEFILLYGKLFNVDVSNFMAADYFDPEGDIILPALLRLFTGKAKASKKILTINHLEKGINFGRLDEKVINDY